MNIIGVLYDRTFFEITDKQQTKNEIKHKLEAKINLRKVAEAFIKPIGYLLVTFVLVLNYFFYFLNINLIAEIIISIVSGIIGLTELINASYSFSKTLTKKVEFNRKTLYDNEIADFHFHEILKNLTRKKIKVVFVLDELDKVDDVEANKLIKEMKPYLVSGIASFIVVAGQSLYYKYHLANSADDDILSSLFSRIIHIPLFSFKEMQEQFRKLTSSIDGGGEESIRPYLDFLTFRSKKIHRRLVNTIRQDLQWQNKDKIEAILKLPENMEKYKDYSKILKIIDKINDTEIEGKYDPPISDYINMQLFIYSERMINHSKIKKGFNIQDIIDG